MADRGRLQGVTALPGADSGRGDGTLGPDLMRELLLSLPAGVAYVTGPDLVFEFANEAYRRYVGTSELIGRPLREALPDLPRQRFHALDRAAQHGEPFRSPEPEAWIRRRGGRLKQTFVERAYQPVPDGAGGVAGVLIYIEDVTSHVMDRHRLEVLATRLGASQERYRTLFETLPAGVIHYDADGTIIEANPAAAKILGIPSEVMTTWPIDREQRAIHEDGSRFLQAELPVVAAIRTGQVVSDVVIGLPRGQSGELRWLRVTAVPDARDEQGKPYRVYAILADITEQRRAEARSRESARLLARLRDANIFGVAVLTEQSVQEANDAYLDIIGYTRAELEAGAISFRAITPPEYTAVDDETLEQLRSTGAARPWEKEYLNKDGHRVPVLVGAAALESRPLRWTSFVVDLSARQRREQERARLVAREQAARQDAENARRRLAFLLQSGGLADSAAGRDDLAERVSALIDAAVSADHGRLGGDGDEAATRRAREALRAVNAELDDRVIARTTELVRAEADRRVLETELRQTEQLQTVGELTSGIAHDFGNLLAIILGYAAMAEDVSEDCDPELLQILQEIRGAADRAAHLSGDLLRFSRRTRSSPEDLDVNAVITDLNDLLTVSMSGRGKVVCHLSRDALPAVRAERDRVERVLLNLAVNARDAMPAGGTLTISTRYVDLDGQDWRRQPGIRPGRYVEIAVHDTGTGMSQAVKARIFERFFTTKPEQAGTGLGLWTVHGIVTDLGGAIEVDSVEGKGATFRIYLPAARTASGPG